MALLGWNSLDSVTRIHNRLEITGFVLLGILALVEGLQWVYGNRKDDLSAQAIASSIAQVQQSYIEAHAERRLMPEQSAMIVKAIRHFPHQIVVVWCPMADGEAKQYADDFKATFDEAGWNCETQVAQAIWDNIPIGVEVAISPQDWAARRISPAVFVLMHVFEGLGIIPEKEIQAEPDIKKGQIAVIVGRKPPTS